MALEKLTKKDVELLNSKVGMKVLFSNKDIDLEKVIERTLQEKKLKKLQEQLIKMQTWVIEKKKKVVIIFEGRDAAGKGGAIRRITQRINPRHFRVVALNVPTPDEKQQWFFQRYVNRLPKPGEIVFFDRSWYNRAVVEPVNGFCTKKEYDTFMSQVNDFEEMIISSDTYLIKFYFSITKEEQARRFVDIKNSRVKHWKITPVDRKAQKLWDEYTVYKDKMFEVTNTKLAPWVIIDANKKYAARIKAIEHILDTIPYRKG